MTLQQAYHKVRYSLSSIYHASESEAIALRLLEQVTGQPRLPHSGQRDMELSVYHQLILEKQLQELLGHKPLQYVLNEAWFMGRPFYVDQRVLIPRPETEELVDWVLKDPDLAFIVGQPIKVLDIGTGSGCIAISLKLARNEWEVTALDVSTEALEVAKKNAKEMGAEIQLDHFDITADPVTCSRSGFHLIVSNPPYIPFSLQGTLAPQVERFEPAAALFVQQEDPLFYYLAIARFGRVHLYSGGFIYVEVHHDRAADVAVLFTRSGYVEVEIRKDMQGVDRMVKAQWFNGFESS